MRTNSLLSLLLILTLTGIVGCAKWQGAMGIDSNLRQDINVAVDQLITNSRIPMAPETTFLVGSLVNIDALEQSSTLGRTLSEYIISRLVWSGFNAIEIKLRQSLFIKDNNGEFLLSRDINALSQQHHAQSLIVGTYSIGEHVIYVSLRMVNPETSAILATTEFEAPLGTEARRLLQNDSLY